MKETTYVRGPLVKYWDRKYTIVMKTKESVTVRDKETKEEEEVTLEVFEAEFAELL